MATTYKVDKDLKHLSVASPEELKSILVQYRYFTIYYISDLSYLVAKLPFGEVRSALSRFLSEELGDGDPKGAHPELYDSFLRSVGVNESQFNIFNQRNKGLLDGIQRQVKEESPSYALGLRGMGGECLCQIYLAAMHDHFIQNPYIESLKSEIDWRFWKIHTGEEDIAHKEKTRAAIDNYIKDSPSELHDLANGYEKSKAAWDTFWSNIFFEAKRPLKLVK